MFGIFRWTIRARVIQKSAIKKWSNSRGDGTLFSMTLLDNSGEIKATAFRDQVDKYYDMLEMNKVKYINSEEGQKVWNQFCQKHLGDWHSGFCCTCPLGKLQLCWACPKEEDTCPYWKQIYLTWASLNWNWYRYLPETSNKSFNTRQSLLHCTVVLYIVILCIIV